MNRIFVNRQLVAHTLLLPLFVSVPVFVTVVIFADLLLASILALAFYVVLLGILLIFRHNAFTRIEINEFGIKSRHLSFSWQQIDELGDYRIYRIALYKYTLLKPIQLPSVIGLGENKKSEFYFQSKKETLMFSLDKKTVSLLERFGKQSTAIRKILERYSVE